MDNQCSARDFHEVAASECPLNRRHIAVKQEFKFNVADVPGRNEQERRLTGQQERLNEITILGHYDPVVAYRACDNVRIRRTIPKWQVQCMQGIVPMLL